MAETPPTPLNPDAPQESFRWQGFFQHTTEPLFLLNKRRRLLFANRAWEALTGLSLQEVRGQPCKRIPQPEKGEPWQILLGALLPPPEVWAGRPGVIRRRVAQGPSPGWWEIAFFPLQGSDGPLAILGKITVFPFKETTPEQPLPEKILQLRDRYVERFDVKRIGSDLPAMVRVKDQAQLAAQTQVPVLLIGPPGSGKHWLARAIHQLGTRRETPFIRLDCTRLAPSILAHVLIAQLSRLASATIYLREPGLMSGELQARLSQWLNAQQEPASGEKPRLLAGTSAGTGQEEVRLLPELSCQLSTLTITLPALKDRLEDLDWLVPLLLTRTSEALGRPLATLSAEALQIMHNHSWPGNLRELYDVLLGACSRAKENRIEAADLPFYLQASPRPVEQSLPLDALLEQVEKRLIVLALQIAQNNKTRAAELLGIWRPRLIRRLEALGLQANETDD